ncbi:DNA damage-inducible transcript 4-like protein [Protopterus annectens]|uniref:DNA damage-inducible transcript 4-like protein n=1 Tax=Protopterus annectens TaxID=7888 RepID=UPI001CFB067A|nr:DNA damage-inducible transcript 4-like protein [Protopterus annectens]
MVATRIVKNKNFQSIAEDLLGRNYTKEIVDSDTDYWDHMVKQPNLCEEVFEDLAFQQLARILEGCLSRAKHRKLHCLEVLVPEKLTRRIARDVLCLASTEPCGIRGCNLYVNLEIKMCKKLDKIVYDCSVVPTFELMFIFKQDEDAWSSLRDFFFIRTCFAPTFRHAL